MPLHPTLASAEKMMKAVVKGCTGVLFSDRPSAWVMYAEGLHGTAKDGESFAVVCVSRDRVRPLIDFVQAQEWGPAASPKGDAA